MAVAFQHEDIGLNPASDSIIYFQLVETLILSPNTPFASALPFSDVITAVERKC